MTVRLGGRKFILTLICMAIGTAIELKVPGGISPSFTTLLVALVGSFSVANVVATKTYNDSKQPAEDPAMSENISQIQSQVANVSQSVALIGETLLNASKGLTNGQPKKN